MSRCGKVYMGEFGNRVSNRVVKITGGQEIKDVSVQGIHSEELVKTLNEAIKKSQEVAAKKLQSMTGGLGSLLGK